MRQRLIKAALAVSATTLTASAWLCDRLERMAGQGPMPQPRVREVPLDIVHRNLLYDSCVVDPEAVAASIGISPISSDVAEMEREASQRRLADLSQLFPLIEDFSSVLANASVAQQVERMEDGMPDEHQRMLYTATFTCARAAAIAAISNLVDLGLLDTR